MSKAVEIYRAFPDKRSRVASLLGLIGSQHSAEFNFEVALKYWDEALAIYKELGDKTGQTGLLQSKGTMYFLLGDKTKVRENFGQALSILQSPGYTEDFKNLFGPADSGFEVYDELGADMAEHFTQDRIGFAYEMLEDYAKAVRAYERRWRSCVRAKNPSHQEQPRVGRLRLRQDGEMGQGARVLQGGARNQPRGVRAGSHRRQFGPRRVDAPGVGEAAGRLKTPERSLAEFQLAGVGLQKAFTPRYSPMLNDLGRVHHALGNRRSRSSTASSRSTNFRTPPAPTDLDKQTQRTYLAKGGAYRDSPIFSLPKGASPRPSRCWRCLSRRRYSITCAATHPRRTSSSSAPI